MKKLVYIIILSFLFVTGVSSCTDENVQPTTQDGGPMGTGADPKN